MGGLLQLRKLGAGMNSLPPGYRDCESPCPVSHRLQKHPHIFRILDFSCTPFLFRVSILYIGAEKCYNLKQNNRREWNNHGTE